MNTYELFQSQLDKGATDTFIYGLEQSDPWMIKIVQHQGTLDSFPNDLQFIRMMGTEDQYPVFKQSVVEE